MKVKNKETGETFEVIGTYYDKTNGNGEGRVYFGDMERQPLADTTLRSFMTDYEPIDEGNTNFSPVVVSKLAGVEIASQDYVEGDKKHFAFEEALEIERRMRDTGWRLPTRQEWALICEEVGNNCNGELDARILCEKLKLDKNGYVASGTLYYAGSSGYYWSSTAKDSSAAYILSFGSSSVNPSSSSVRYAGQSVRLVRDIEE